MSDIKPKVVDIIEQVIDDKIEKANKSNESLVPAEVATVGADGTIWVRLPGSEEETPAANSTVKYRSGDIVSVRISNGTATIIGNYTTPAIGEEEALAIAEDAAEVSVRKKFSEAAKITEAAKIAADEAQAVAEAVNQHFWDDDNGAHITAKTKEEWDAEYEKEGHGELASPTEEKPWYNQLLGSTGTILRTGLRHLAAWTRSAISFFDGEGNAPENIIATFGINGSVIGGDGGHQVVVSPSRISMYDPTDRELLSISSFGRRADAGITEKFWDGAITQNLNMMRSVYPMGKKYLDLDVENNNAITGLLNDITLSFSTCVREGVARNITSVRVYNEENCSITINKVNNVYKVKFTPTTLNFDVQTPLPSGGYSYNWDGEVYYTYVYRQTSQSVQYSGGYIRVRAYFKISQTSNNRIRIMYYLDPTNQPNFGEVEADISWGAFEFSYSGTVANPIMTFGSGNSAGAYGASFGENNNVDVPTNSEYSYFFGKNNKGGAGNYNFAVGDSNEVWEGGKAIGTGLKSGFDSVAVGKFNNPNASGLFVVGNGTGNTARNNAFRVLDDGTAEAYKSFALRYGWELWTNSATYVYIGNTDEYALGANLGRQWRFDFTNGRIHSRKWNSNSQSWEAWAEVTVGGTLSIARGGTGTGAVSPRKVFCGPSTGTDAAAPSFRYLVPVDIPTINIVDKTNGTLSVERGGTGQAEVTQTTTVSQICTAADGVTIKSASYSQWGKVAQVNIVFTLNADLAGNAVKSPVCNILSGKRPKQLAGGCTAYMVSNLNTNGNVICRNASNSVLTAGTQREVSFTYILP